MITEAAWRGGKKAGGVDETLYMFHLSLGPLANFSCTEIMP